MTEQFLNSIADIQWLKDTHLADWLKENPSEFASFILSGNEDCPVRLILYAERNPTIGSRAVADLIMDSDVWQTSGIYKLIPRQGGAK